MTDFYFSHTEDDFLMLTTKKSNLTFKQLSDNISKELKFNNFNTVLLKQIHSNIILHANNSGF